MEIVTAEAGRPGLPLDQLLVRNVDDRLIFDVEVLVAIRAGGGNHRNAHAFMLAMAGHA